MPHKNDQEFKHTQPKKVRGELISTALFCPQLSASFCRCKKIKIDTLHNFDFRFSLTGAPYKMHNIAYGGGWELSIDRQKYFYKFPKQRLGLGQALSSFIKYSI